MRAFLLMAALVAVPAYTQQVPPQVATATRSGDQVTLDWQGLTAPVSVTMATNPEGKGAKPVAGKQVDVAAAPRPYFFAEDAKGQKATVAERVLPLAGGNNFRDLGGYATADGRHVRLGQLYRSGVMSGLTSADFDYLGDLGIRTICDLRSNEERTREAVTWPAGIRPVVLSRDYGMDMGAMAQLFQSANITAEQTSNAMAGFYKGLPFEFAGQYAQMFRALVNGGAPLAFNCSAGKDRTGVAAAMLLTVLGVPRETVIADYLFSNTYFRAPPPKPGQTPDASMLAMSKLPPDALKALMGVDRRYLESAFTAIEAKGGMARYVREDLKLSAADVAKLKTAYLE